MKPDQLFNSIYCEDHFNFAIKLGLLPPETAQLPISTLASLYPEMSQQGIYFYMKEQARGLFADPAFAEVGNLPRSWFFSVSSSEAYKTIPLISNILDRTPKSGDRTINPIMAATTAVFYTDSFHSNLGIRYYENAISLRTYLKCFYSVIPDELTPQLPEWMRGVGW